MKHTTFKNWFETSWQRDMGVPNQIDNPVFDKYSNGDNSDDQNEPRNNNYEAIDNMQALGNHLRAITRLVTRIVKSKKFFGLEKELLRTFEEFKHKIEDLLIEADTRKVQQPQVGDESQGVPLQQQIKPEMAEKLKDEQPPRMPDPSFGRPYS